MHNFTKQRMRRQGRAAVLVRIRQLASRRRVRFTTKALQELAILDMGLDEEDACDVLASLAPSDLVERFASKKTGEWMYVFKPSIGGIVVYVEGRSSL